MDPYAKGLDRNEANYAALTPVSFLAKAAYVYPDRVAVVHGALRRTWREEHGGDRVNMRARSRSAKGSR